MNTRLIAACLVVTHALAFYGGYLWASPKPVATGYTSHSQARLPGGGTLAARAVAPLAPAAPVPPAAKPQATFSVTVRPRVVYSAPAPGAAPTCSCEPVTVDGTLVKQPDGQPDLVASATGGTIDQATLTVPPTVLAPPVRPWAAGVSYDTDQHVGLVVERDAGPLRVGFGAQAGTARAYVMWRF